MKGGATLKHLPEEIRKDWLVWRLYMQDKLPLADFGRITLDDADLANRLLDSIAAARPSK